MNLRTKELLVIGLFGAAIVILIYGGFLKLTGFSVFENSLDDFSNGTYSNLNYNGSAIVFSGENLSGNYTSEVFDADGNAAWESFSWEGAGEIVFFLRSCDDALCSGEMWEQIILEKSSEIDINNDSYFQYRADFFRDSSSEDVFLTNVSIVYNSSNLSPTLSVSSPVHGGVYGSNESIPLEFSVSDENISSCWYSVNSGLNLSLPDCENTSLSLAEGNFSLALFVNDSENLVRSEIVNFSVYNGVPTTYLVSPLANAFSNESDVYLEYYVNDSDLNYCNVVHNFGGSVASEQDNDTFSGEINSFGVVSAADGSYNWRVECFDTTGNNSRTSNRLVNVDTITPSVSLTSPSGTFSRKNNIPLEISVEDASAISCVYTLTHSGSGPVLVVVMPQCQATSFNVAQDGDYQLSVLVTDSAGNSALSTTDFSVESDSSQNENSGGGGGGGGASVDVPSINIAKISIEEINKLFLRPGFSDDVQAKMINTGNRFLNNCSIAGNTGYQSWIDYRGVFSLSPGEQIEQLFELQVPRETFAGEHEVNAFVVCNELSEEFSFLVEVIPADFEFEFIKYEVDGINLLVDYSLKDLTQRPLNVNLRYTLADLSMIPLLEGSYGVNVAPGNTEQKMLSFELPKDSFGEFYLILNFSTEEDSFEAREKLFLPSSRVTGFAISESNKKTLSWVVAALLFILCVFFGWKYLKQRKKAANAVSV